MRDEGSGSGRDNEKMMDEEAIEGKKSSRRPNERGIWYTKSMSNAGRALKEKKMEKMRKREKDHKRDWVLNTHWQAVITVRFQQIRQGKEQRQEKAHYIS